MKKKAILKQSVIALLVFSMIISGFWLLPKEEFGFWSSYGYTTTGDNSEMDVSTNASRIATDVICDIDPQAESCVGFERNPYNPGTVIEGIVGGGYGALISITKSFGLFTKIAYLANSTTDAIPPFIPTILLTMLLFAIGFTLILIIFNRSDSG